MPRYILFGGDRHYPNGGFRDYIASSGNLELLLKNTKQFNEDDHWWHIFDLVNLRFVASCEKQAFLLDGAEEE